MQPASRQRRAITTELAAVRQRLKDIRAGASSRPREASTAEVCCPVTFLIAEMVYHLSGGDVAAASDFTMTARRNKNNLMLEALPALATAWASRSAEEVQHLLETAPGAADRRRRAEGFLAQRRLREWVTKQNVEKGLAPSSRSILAEAVAIGHMPVGPREAGASNAAQKRQKARETKWFQRWSRRFRLARGRFQAGPPVGAAEALEKAPPGPPDSRPPASGKPRPPGPFLAPDPGPPGGPRSGARY